MTDAGFATAIGALLGASHRAFFAQAVPMDVPAYLTSAGVGGALVLIFWIVARELPENRKARREAHAIFSANLDKIATQFHDELAREREAARVERTEYAKERIMDRELRHATADAMNAVATTVRELSEVIDERNRKG